MSKLTGEIWMVAYQHPSMQGVEMAEITVFNDGSEALFEYKSRLAKMSIDCKNEAIEEGDGVYLRCLSGKEVDSNKGRLFAYADWTNKEGLGMNGDLVVEVGLGESLEEHTRELLLHPIQEVSV